MFRAFLERMYLAFAEGKLTLHLFWFFDEKLISNFIFSMENFEFYKVWTN